MILISVIICTHNRAQHLQKALESLSQQTLDSDTFEILIIDNNSTDNTKQISEDFIKSAKNTKYYFETKLGLSNARNRGVAESSSDILLFIDDDAVACPELVERHLNAYTTITPKPSCVAGKIFLDWEKPKPDWYPDTRPYQRSLSYLDYGDQERFIELQRYEYPFGANVSFIKQDLIAAQGFDANLGRIGSNLLSNEELKIFDYLFLNKKHTYYDPSGYVYHLVPKERISKIYFYRRFYWQGVSNAIWFPEVWTMPRNLTRHFFLLLKAIFTLTKLYITRKNQKKKFASRCDISYHFGFITKKIMLKLFSQS